MAKKFAGFTEDQTKVLLNKVGFTGQSMQQDEVNAFLAANPSAQAKLGKYAEAAQKRLDMLTKPTTGYAEGGAIDPLVQQQDANNVMPQAAKQTYPPTGAAATYNPMNQVAASQGMDMASFEAKIAANKKYADEQYQLLKAQPYVKDEEFWKKDALQAAQDPQSNQQIGRGFDQLTRAPGALSNMYKQYGLTEGVDTIEDVKREYELYNRASQNVQASEGLKLLQGQSLSLNLQPNTLDTARQNVATTQAVLAKLQQDYATIAPSDTAAQTAAKAAIDAQQIKVTQAQAGLGSEVDTYQTLNMPTKTEIQTQAFADPNQLTTKADVSNIVSATSQTIDPTTGQISTTTPVTPTTTATPTTPAVVPTSVPAATITPAASSTGVQSTLDKLAAATGKVGPDALVAAATMTPDQLAALGLTVEQIDQARTVVAPAPRVVQQGEMIAGSTVDMAAVDKAVNFEAATGAPSSAGTVQGQLTSLMQQFEGDATPAWAAGAMRAATAALASRGLGASSMAGQAIIQATMESALPIAMQDAQTNAGFELQNLSNRQATAMFGAQQRATFLGMDFDQKFQARVANASRVADIANMNFSAEQQVALENARMAQTVDLTNLSAKNAKVMADAATLSQMDMTNLNNRQQAAVTNAQAFLQMDMANLDKEQQTSMFKSQSMVNSLLSDTAAANAAKQFNAASENQTNQFFANIASTISQFNTDQANAMQRFNAGEANTIAQFNSTLANQREQFNASNSLIIEQANAQWAQTITTTNNAAINAANRDQAISSNNLTTTAYNNILQQERDIMNYAFQTANNNAERATSLALANISADATITSAEMGLKGAQADASATKASGLATAAGSVLGAMFTRGIF